MTELFIDCVYGVNTEIFFIFNFFNAFIVEVIGVVTWASGFAKLTFSLID